MAHKKAAGSAKNLRDSNAKYRGVKVFGGQTVLAGNIIIRQKGDKYHAGLNTYKGKDFSIHALVDGIVTFKKKNISRFDGRKYLKTVVQVETPESVIAKKDITAAAKAEKAPKVEATEKVEKTEKAPKAEKAPAAKKAAPKAEKAVKTEKAEKAPAAKKAPAKKTTKKDE